MPGDFIVSCIETFFVFVYFNLVLQLDSKKRKAAAMGAFLLAAFISALNMMEISPVITAILRMVVDVFYAFFCFKSTRIERLLYGCSFSVITFVSKRATVKMAGLVSISKLSGLLVPGVTRYEMAPVYYLICFILIIIIACFKKNRMSLPLSYRISFVILISGGVMALEKMLDAIIELDGTHGFGRVVAVLEVACLFLLIVFLAMMYIIMKAAFLYQEKSILQEKHNEEKYISKEFELMKNSLESLRGWKHDMKNHFRVIFELIKNGKNEDAGSYIEKIFGEMEWETVLTETTNPVLNVIIAAKYMRAKHAGIVFDYQMHIEGELPLAFDDLTTILGNILDNAIEANLKLDKERHRFIHVKIRSLRKMLLISVANSSDGIYERKGKQFISLKDEKSGIGLRQVERAVDKNRGFMNVSAKEDVFIVTVCIPIVGEVKNSAAN